MPKVSIEASKRLLAKAALQGGLMSKFSGRLDVKGVCIDAKEISFYTPKTPYLVEAIVPCNQCVMCRWSKRKHWEERMHTELMRAARSWFCTLTASPAEHLKWEMVAKSRKYTKGQPWHKLTTKQKGRLINRVAVPDLQKWVKRVRKAHDAPKMLRHIIIPEFHTKKLLGKPHFHVLLHEVSADYPIRKKRLDTTWHKGFTNFKLVNNIDKSCSYVSKYVAKDEFHDGCRIKSSLRYGLELPAKAPNNKMPTEEGQGLDC